MKTRTKSLFYKRIRCSHCNGQFKSKKERGKTKYICTNYDLRGSCLRILVEEEFILELLEKRLDVTSTREVIEEYVEEIIVEDKTLLEIKLKDQESILMSRKHLRF